jgi:exopolyphosphatase / guanosine-5'-triphosphate,3'-diphosphate pyrophosphatase
MAEQKRRVAVVDLGSNSTRLLVADVENGQIEELARDTRVTRLGEDVDTSGRLGDAAMERVLDAMAAYRETIDSLAAEHVVAVATSAVRDAENGEELRATMRDRYAIDPRIIPGEEEARLTFLGATAGRPAEDETLVLDIGGGSTEMVIGHPGSEPRFHVSTQLGSVRQTERHLRHDPPERDELAALAEEAQRTIAGNVPEEIREAVDRGIAVAGTPTSLAAIAQSLDPYDPERVHGYRLTLGESERILAELAALPEDERRGVTGLHPDRAPTIVAGAVILVEAMRLFGLEWIETSEADILHGAALAS